MSKTTQRLIVGSSMFFVSFSMLCTASAMQVDKEQYPYAPSLIQWEKSSAEFTEPSTCGECHPDKYEEWRGSMHSLAFQDPIYQGELNLAIAAVGHDIAKQCEGCHTAAAVVTGEIKGAGLKDLSPMAMAGVSCDVCHSIKGHTHWQTPTHQPENGSFILSPGKEVDGETILTKYGPFPQQKIVVKDSMNVWNLPCTCRLSSVPPVTRSPTTKLILLLKQLIANGKTAPTQSKASPVRTVIWWSWRPSNALPTNCNAQHEKNTDTTLMVPTSSSTTYTDWRQKKWR